MSLDLIVCVKQVPVEPVFAQTADAYQLNRGQVEGIMNHHDRYAVEASCQLRHQLGGRVTAISMGPPQAEEVLREVLSLGADEAILLTDPAFAGADTLATSRTLAAAIQKIGRFNLILCGVRTSDSDTGQVGPQLAEFLRIPMVAYAESLRYEKGRLWVQRKLDGQLETLLVELPALVTISGSLYRPRYPSMAALEASFCQRHVERWGPADIGVDSSRIGWKGSATVAKELYYPKRKRLGQIVQTRSDKAARMILDVLISRNVLGD
jgi:electron transfer flavoprotein beta subunit